MRDVGPDPIAWIDRLIEVNAGSQFTPRQQGYIHFHLESLREGLLEYNKDGAEVVETVQ